MRECDISDVVDRSARELSAQVEEDRNVIVTVQGTDTEIEIDPSHLNRLLTELGENALTHGEGDIEYDVDANEEHIFISVIDEGEGLDDNEKSVIETGVETSLEHSSGIGLWTVSWLVSEFGGQLSVNDSGENTEVRLLIPKDRSENEARSAMGYVDIEQ